MKQTLRHLTLLAGALAGAASQINASEHISAQPDRSYCSIWVTPSDVEWATKGLGSQLPPILQQAKELLDAKPLGRSAQVGWGFPNDGWQLGLRMHKPEFAVHEPVWIWALIANLSDTNRQLMALLPYALWDIQLVASDNHSVQSKAFGLRRSDGSFSTPPMFTFRQPAMVEAGRVSLHLLSLGVSYDLEQPGTYYVTLSRSISGDRNTGFSQVMSGTASFRIVEQPAKPSEANKEMPASSGSAVQTSIRDAPTNIADLSSASATQQIASVALALPSGKADVSRNVVSTDAQASELLADSASSSEETTRLGFAWSPVRIGASVFVLLVAAAFVYILLRRARRPS